jgi:C1A family cysteine protease
LIGGQIAKLYLKQIKGYFSIQPGNMASVRNALNNGCPVVFGMPTDTNYARLKNDNAYVDKVEGSTGFHAQIIVGYLNRDNIRYYIVRNSWDDTWGDKGYSYINEDVIKDKGFDLWTLM